MSVKLTDYGSAMTALNTKSNRLTKEKQRDCPIFRGLPYGWRRDAGDTGALSPLLAGQGELMVTKTVCPYGMSRKDILLGRKRQRVCKVSPL